MLALQPLEILNFDRKLLFFLSGLSRDALGIPLDSWPSKLGPTGDQSPASDKLVKPRGPV